MERVMGIEPTWSAWESCPFNSLQQIATVKTVSYAVIPAVYNCDLL